MAGVLITLEGGEGSGKSTQAEALYQRLLLEGKAALLVREPGGTPAGERVRALLKAQHDERSTSSGNGGTLTPVTELLLFCAARAQLVDTVLRPALEEGHVVVCDRYTASTVAYQGYGRGLPLEDVERANRLATGGLEPDLVLLLDTPLETGRSRIEGRSDGEGRRFEEEPAWFHGRVRDGYLAQAKADPDRWLVVDGTLAQEQVAETIWRRVEPLVKG
jgi:dTMP kinase